ncbi:AAA family ATPase [Treponema pedis]
MIKRLPIGIHTFSEIILDNYVYIDKTKETYELIGTYKYVFL